MEEEFLHVLHPEDHQLGEEKKRKQVSNLEYNSLKHKAWQQHQNYQHIAPYNNYIYPYNNYNQ